MPIQHGRIAVDVAAWLRELGLARYEDAFRDNDVDADVLAELDETDLEKLGVSLGHRKKLLKAIAELRAPSGAASALPLAVSRPDGGAEKTKTTEAERRQLTVMFCDLVGSTALSARLDPEDMGVVIRAYQDCCADVVKRWDGHVAKFMGDGLLAYFGWPVAHEDDAERAVRAGLAMIDALAGLETPAGEPLAARVGIATGLVMVGELIGEGAAKEQTVVGETPNLAARLQMLAAPGNVVISQATRRLVGGLFELDDLGPQRLKGFAEPLLVWRVVGESAAESRFEARHVARLAPTVGREHELALMGERWARAMEGEGQVILLSGEAGIGKSRLARSLIEALVTEPHTRLRYQCSPYHTNSAFYPIIERLERAAAFEKGDQPAAKLEKLEALLGQSSEGMAETVPLFAALLSIPTADHYPALNLSPQQQKQRLLEVLVDQVEALAARRPVLMICEDAHWIDPSTQEVFGLLMERIERLPILMLLTFRPEYRPPWPGHAHVTQLSLSRLSRRQGTEILDRLAGGKCLPIEVMDQILLKADGVPLFIEELTKTVLESGLLADAGDHYKLSGPLPPLAIPATLQDSLMARLDRLAPVKEVAQVASVIGREFSHDVLTAVADRPEPEIGAALDQLVWSELIFRRGIPPKATYSFKHALVQETAYRSLLRGKRQLLHSRIAQFLKDRSPQVAELQPELLAYHFGEAGFGERAAKYWLKAGRRAKDGYANREATAQLQKCLAAAVSGDGASLSPIRMEALLLLGDLAGLAEDLDRANACYQQALNLAADEATRAAVRNKLHRPRVAIRNAARIAFYEHGSGEHTLLFVNPIVYGLAIFQPILEQLCQEFRIVTVDCRGTGASDPLTRPFPLREHVEDVAAVIDALGCGAVTGVGISRGSNLLIILATLRPQLIDRLVLVGCPLAPAGFGESPTFSAEYSRQRAEAYERNDIDALLRIQSEFVYSEPGTEELKRLVLAHRLKLPSDTILSFYDPDPGANVAPLVARLTVPTLVTHGTDDRLISFTAAEYLAKALPKAQLYAFKGKGHVPIFTATEEFCDVVRRFVLAGSVATS
jgi:class 3 adenylate cyclase/pimeloyl-ACP methyl ester carboxylesterase